MTENEARERARQLTKELEAYRVEVLAFQSSLPVSPQEGRRRDLDEDPDVLTEMRTVLRGVVAESLTSALGALKDVTVYKPEPVHAAELNLEVFHEDTRRTLYDLVVKDNFTERALDPEADPPEVWVPPYTPDEAKLEIFFQFGRWFATWLKLEMPADAPEHERQELLRLEPHRHRPGDIEYSDV